MIRTDNRSQTALLEKYRVALEKAGSIPRIAQAMEKTGYHSVILDEGKMLLASSWEVYNKNLRLKDELALVRTEYADLRKQLDIAFREQRNKAIMLFRRDRKMMDFLAISGEYPVQMDPWMETMRKFYTEILKDPEIQQRFKRLNFSVEEAEAGLKNIGKLETLYAKCVKAKGVSQNATEQKNIAFAEISDWMSDFYWAAKLALKKHPRLLDVLYKTT